MGIDFRGKGNTRRVRIGKRTVKDGEAVAVWDQYGTHRQVIGPALLRLWWSTIRFLEHHIAGSEEYLKVQKRDGTVEHVRGPAALFENPVYHRAVSVEKAIVVPDASSHIVVLHKSAGSSTGSGSQAGSVATLRSIVSGPTIFFPEPTDTLHKFEWTNSGGGALSKDMFVLRLQKQVVSTLKFLVGDSNGHTATISLSLCAQVVGVEEALSVNDPVASCGALAQAVVLGALASCDFAEQGTSLHVAVQGSLSMDTVTEKLSKTLRTQAAVELISLTVTGVTPSGELEKIHRKEDDLASAKVAEQLAAMSLDAAVARQEQEQKLDRARQAHELALQAERHQAGGAHADLQDQRRIANLKELKKMNVDMTKYLMSANRGPGPGSEDQADESRTQSWGCWHL